MTHLPSLISDLGYILIVAAAVTVLFKFLKQPVVLGYILAGFLLGPNFPYIHTVNEIESVKVWAEIGVIILLFSLGLEFSFKKLAKVGKSAAITALVQVSIVLFVGYALGTSLGWNKINSLFLGGILSISSTTIIVKAFDEFNLKGKKFVNLVFGVLIIEDLFAILLMVVLSTIAVTQTLSGSDLLFSTFRLGFFLALWFILGIYFLPFLLKKLKPVLNNETLLVVSIGLCLMMVMIAAYSGFSAALGAFVMGSLLAETNQGHKIEELIVPIKDFFSAVFFVSVGMLIDLQSLSSNFNTILIITSVFIVFKILSASLGAIISGESFRSSVQTGLSLAQIGEFSFIIATLGLTLKVTDESLYPIAVAISAITTFTTPYMIKSSDKIATWLEAKLPDAFKERLNRYQVAANEASDINPIKIIWSLYGPRTISNFIITIGIALAAHNFFLPKFLSIVGDSSQVRLFTGVITLILCSPFLWAMCFSVPQKVQHQQIEVLKKVRSLQFGLFFVRSILGILVSLYIVSLFTPNELTSFIVLTFIAALILLFSSKSVRFYNTLENRFLKNLNAKEREEIKKNVPVLAPWNASLSEFTLSAESELIGKTLKDAQIKEKYGVSIALIERGSKKILAPGRDTLLMTHDKLYLIGTEDQLTRAKDVIEPQQSNQNLQQVESFGLQFMILNEPSNYINKTIRECGLREAVGGLIVGIEREGQRILNPDSNLILNKKDVVWLVGDTEKIKSITV